MQIEMSDMHPLPDGVHVTPDTNLSIKFTITPR